jgi:hypothetical protein
MPVSLTEKEFSEQLNTKFRTSREDGSAVELELVEVKSYLSGPNEQSGMERFSAFFRGPGELPLAQKTYTLSHDRMGEFEIFLVPIGQQDGVRYEAVFNYFKNQ